MPRRDPRRATDAGARSAGSEHDRTLTTGEPDAWKLARPVRRGADGKGRSRLPVTAEANGPTDPDASAPSPPAYLRRRQAPRSVLAALRRRGHQARSQEEGLLRHR